METAGARIWVTGRAEPGQEGGKEKTAVSLQPFSLEGSDSLIRNPSTSIHEKKYYSYYLFYFERLSFLYLLFACCATSCIFLLQR